MGISCYIYPNKNLLLRLLLCKKGVSEWWGGSFIWPPHHRSFCSNLTRGGRVFGLPITRIIGSRRGGSDDGECEIRLWWWGSESSPSLGEAWVWENWFSKLSLISLKELTVFNDSMFFLFLRYQDSRHRKQVFFFGKSTACIKKQRHVIRKVSDSFFCCFQQEFSTQKEKFSVFFFALFMQVFRKSKAITKMLTNFDRNPSSAHFHTKSRASYLPHDQDVFPLELRRVFQWRGMVEWRMHDGWFNHGNQCWLGRSWARSFSEKKQQDGCFFLVSTLYSTSRRGNIR